MSTPANLAKLKEARDAYHSLRTGTAPRVVVDQNGSRVEYAVANSTGLYAYIQELEALCGCAVPIPSMRGPARFTF